MNIHFNRNPPGNNRGDFCFYIFRKLFVQITPLVFQSIIINNSYTNCKYLSLLKFSMNSFKKVVFLISITLLASSLNAQSDTDSVAGVIRQAELKGDTLVTSAGLTIYAGQKLMIGNPARPDGLFRSIISSKAAIVPNIWGRKNRGYENDIENYVDNKKWKEKMKNELIPGVTVTIKKISLIGNPDKYHYYMAILIPESGEDYYRTDILFALKINELVLK